MSQPMAESLKFEVVGNVGVLTINRPEKLNAFTYEMLEGWSQLLEECGGRDDVRVLVLTGAGRGFCAGGDIDSFAAIASTTASAIQREVRYTQQVQRAITRLNKPVIAAINGFATGGGLDIALACDMRFAAESARLAENYVRLGLLPGLGGGWLLPRLVGLGRAMELLITGDFIDAREAERIGLVNRVYTDAELMPRTLEIAKRIADNPPLSVQAIKRITLAGLGTDFEDALELAASNLPIVRTSADHKEALAAFREKRKPTFHSR
ncbi:MAG TPA: enoyl-CoA hydratase/isomerase family protein [Ramlibacter sp.]|nr:enoyl-CoA hydratase/isomerase family protein [Ramlibacter sp.]